MSQPTQDQSVQFRLESDANRLFGLEGLAVARVIADGVDGPVVHVVTADETAAGCPSCGVISVSVKGRAVSWPRDLPHGLAGLSVVWRKRRWRRAETACQRRSFTESLPAIPARARLTTRRPNAYAAGGHSVAVTSRVLEDYRTGRLSDEQAVAVLVHELGHHATGATRSMLFVMWLAAPWRAAARLLAGLGSALSGRQSRRCLGIAGLSGVVAAVVRVVHQGHWLAGGVVAAVVLFAVVCPLADAWVCRRAEFVADRFAADRGLAIGLTAALSTLDDGPSAIPR